MNAVAKFTPVDEATQFLELLAPGEIITFQMFGEGTAKGNPKMNKILHGTLAEHRAALTRYNQRGAGVFTMVNAGDGKGRRASNVQRIRAYFVDFDNVYPPDPTTVPLPPHVIIESSPGRWHWYWKVTDAPLEVFNTVQSALAERLGGDTSVCDLPRVMRLPGFCHHKSEPFLTRIHSLECERTISHAEFIQAFNIDPKTQEGPLPPDPGVVPKLAKRRPAKRTLPETIPEGERNTTLLSLAAGLVRDGFASDNVNRRLQKINAERCHPPLDAVEVDKITVRALTYGSNGFAQLPHELFDSQMWKSLTPHARDVVLIALRRYNGSDEPIALTWSDAKDIKGLGRQATYYAARSIALKAGFLVHVGKGGNTQTGRRPDLFQIAPRWLSHLRK